MCYSYTVYHSVLLLTILSIAVQSFEGGDILRLFKPVVWVTLSGFLQLPPCFLEEHILVLWLSILVSSLFLSSSFLMEGMKLPLYRW